MKRIAFFNSVALMLPMLFPSHLYAKQEKTLLKLSKTCVTSSGTKRELYNSSGLFQDPPTELRIYNLGQTTPHIIGSNDKLFRSAVDSINNDILSESLKCQGTAQFSETEIENLKADLQNYAGTSCKEEKYLKSAIAIADKWTLSKTASHTVIEINRSDATEGIRQAMNAASKTSLSPNVCATFVKGITKHLVDLPVDKVFQKADPSKAAASKSVR